MISLGTKVTFRDPNWENRRPLVGVVVGRTFEKDTHYDVRVETMICSNIPERHIEELRDA